jgi:hypothetical protein
MIGGSLMQVGGVFLLTRHPPVNRSRICGRMGQLVRRQALPGGRKQP